jgi:hypothetical protein
MLNIFKQSFLGPQPGDLSRVVTVADGCSAAISSGFVSAKGVGSFQYDYLV